MGKNLGKTYFIPIITIVFGGLLMVGLVYFLYLITYLLLEFLFFKNNPNDFPMDYYRHAFSIFIFGLFLFFSFVHWPRLLKAIVFIGPLTMLFVTITLTFYETPFFGFGINLLIGAVIVFINIRSKSPWYVYFSFVFSLLVATFYAWPHP